MPPEPRLALSLRDRRLWLPLLLLLVLAAALRILPLHHEALSGDEVFSRRIVTQSGVAGLAGCPSGPRASAPLYAVLKGTTELWGTGALALRVVSLVCGLLALPVIVLLGNKLPGSRWSGLLAAACVAVGRYDIFYSQEARSYALYTLVVLLLALWLAHLTEQDLRWPFWAMGCGLMTVLVYTHYVGGIFVSLAIVSVWLSRVSLAAKLRTLGCGVVALLIFLPWILGEIGIYRAKHGLGETLTGRATQAFTICASSGQLHSG